MTVDQLRGTRPEHIGRDGPRDGPRRRRYDPRRTTRRRVDAAREWLARFTPSANGSRDDRNGSSHS